MTIELKGETRYDTRGLPEGFDPHKLYEYRRDTLVKEASGLESFLYKYIPWSVIKSFAFAIDPTAPFKVAPGVITPMNRVKIRQTDSVLHNRVVIVNRTRWSTAHNPNFHISACWDPNESKFNGNENYVSAISSQPAQPDYLKDTTSRTRLVGSSQGELEYFKSYKNAPARRITTGVIKDDSLRTWPGPNDPLCESFGGIQDPGTHGQDFTTYTVAPTGAWLQDWVFYERRAKELDYCYALSRNNALSMFKDWSPLKRDYTLFRNIVELRDLPRSVTQLRETMSNFRSLFASLSSSPKTRKIVFDLKASAKDVPKEYLSYNFGWKQTYKDLLDLLFLPEKLAKRTSFAITRSGKPTTFRTKRKISSAESNVSGFNFEPLPGEYEIFSQARIERESELRLVINATFDFPPINVPSFRDKHFLDRVGAIPRVTDIYNLVPWTWLVDWFTGLGNYVEVIDNINSDPSLINWGMITCHTNGKLIQEWQSKSDLISRTAMNFVNVAYDQGVTKHDYTAQLVFECQTRKDMAQILDVKTTSDPGKLSLYQKSILGALLAQRNGHFRGT